MRIVVLLWLLSVCSALSLALGSETISVVSRSKQFVAIGLKPGASPFVPRNPKAVARLKLDPGVVVVSCERIKAALLTELGMTDRWQGVNSGGNLNGRIYLSIRPAIYDQIVVLPFLASEGWNFRLELPSEIESGRFVEAIVQVLLLELANRGGKSGSIELPRWLNDGLIAHLESTGLRDLTPQGQSYVNAIHGGMDSLRLVRERIRGVSPLTFEELSWPDDLAQDRNLMFRDCAQLMVYELLHLNNGPACFQKMIMEMPNSRNWQFAFLKGFQPHFSELLDVEKWWALRMVSYTGRDPSRLWSFPETARVLDQALVLSANVRRASTPGPQAAKMSLQQILEEWDYARQKIAFAAQLNELRALQWRAAPELLPLISQYAAVLENYLRQSESIGFSPSRRGQAPPNPKLIKITARKQLDRLDQERIRLKETVGTTAMK